MRHLGHYASAGGAGGGGDGPEQVGVGVGWVQIMGEGWALSDVHERFKHIRNILFHWFSPS